MTVCAFFHKPSGRVDWRVTRSALQAHHAGFPSCTSGPKPIERARKVFVLHTFGVLQSSCWDSHCLVPMLGSSYHAANGSFSSQQQRTGRGFRAFACLKPDTLHGFLGDAMCLKDHTITENNEPGSHTAPYKKLLRLKIEPISFLL